MLPHTIGFQIHVSLITLSRSLLNSDPLTQQASMSREEANGIQMRLVAAEKALATKQQKIDDMKQELFQKEKDLDTVSVFKAQVCACELGTCVCVCMRPTFDGRMLCV